MSDSRGRMRSALTVTAIAVTGASAANCGDAADNNLLSGYGGGTRSSASGGASSAAGVTGKGGVTASGGGGKAAGGRSTAAGATASSGGRSGGGTQGGGNALGGRSVGGTIAAGATSSTGGAGATSGGQAAGGGPSTGGVALGGGRGGSPVGGTGASTGGSGTIPDCVTGGFCPSPGATCTDAFGTLCWCVGPPGAAIITCTAPGGGGSPGSGGIGQGGSTAAGGTNAGGKATGGGTTGGTGTGSAGAPGQLCTDTSPWTTSGTPATRITVDAGQPGPAWNRFYEKVVAADHANTVLATAGGRNIQGALKKGRDQAGFQSVRFHGILNSDIGVYTESNGTAVYNWTRFDQVYDAIAAAGMRPFVEISFTPPPLASNTSSTLHWYNGAPANISPPKDWNKWMAFMTALVEHVEARYGVDEVRNNWYFEVWNEASWMYTLGMAGYNELYGYTVRGLTAADSQIKVGGPAEAGGGSAWGISSLISHARSNSLKLDFVSYHYYGQDSDTNLALANPTVAFHGTMVTNARDSDFTGEIFCTEWGPAYTTPAARDNEIGASFVAKVIHLIGTNAGVPPPAGYGYWTISDHIEEFNSGNATAFRNGNWGMLMKGDARYPESFDVPKAPFNAFRLLHMLGDVSVSTSGGTTSNGVNAQGTLASDNSALQVLVYNHTDGGAADSSGSTLVSVTVNNLPWTGSVRVRHYLLDQTHSNAYDDWVGMGRPNQPTQAQWVTLRDAAELCYYETTITPSANSWTVTFPQKNYSVGLLLLSAAG